MVTQQKWKFKQKVIKYITIVMTMICAIIKKNEQFNYYKAINKFTFLHKREQEEMKRNENTSRK